MVWEIRERFPVWSGALATAGDVVFYGTMDRWFKAVHAVTGEELWRFRTGSGIVGQPVTYTRSGRHAVRRDPGRRRRLGRRGRARPAAGRGPGDRARLRHAVQDLPEYTAEGGAIYVFALPSRTRQLRTPDGTAPGAPDPSPEAPRSVPPAQQ
jgi:lanthanide-dependent methanol dehydrogenase